MTFSGSAKVSLVLTIWVIGASVVLGAVALWTAVEAIRAVRPGWFTVIGFAVGYLVTLAAAITAAILWFTNPAAVSGGLFWGYLACLILVPPVGFFWGIGERSRWGNVVLIVAALTTVILILRVQEWWA